jgi:hypothetical protein
MTLLVAFVAEHDHPTHGRSRHQVSPYKSVLKSMWGLYWCMHLFLLVLTPSSTFQTQFRRRSFLPRYSRTTAYLMDLRGGADDSNDGPSIQEPRIWAEPKRALILMDVFSEYHGIFLSHQAREAYGVATVSVMSDYMKGFFQKEAPHELGRWKREFMPSDEDYDQWIAPLKDYELVAISCESDSGLADAERFACRLNVTCNNGFNEARRNKFKMIQTVEDAGLEVVRQRLCDNVDVALEFGKELGVTEEDGETWAVVKPVRGVASDDVHLCKNLLSIQQAFNKIHRSSVFGSPWEKHDKVLVQEFAIGQEFAVDMVCKDGEKKIAAVWIYDKRPANGAPFVYYATRIYDGELGQTLYDYLSKALEALNIRWGLSHNEVIITKNGPRLVEVNCRQHNMNFLPLTMGCHGYNAFDMLLAAYLGDRPKDSYPPEGAGLRLDWDLLPCIPTRRMHGQMVHLSSFVAGTLISVNEIALMEIQQMDSVLDLEVYESFLQPGNRIEKTIDIRTDCGWVQMVNPDEEAFNKDFERILELMPSLFEVER